MWRDICVSNWADVAVESPLVGYRAKCAWVVGQVKSAHGKDSMERQVSRPSELSSKIHSPSGREEDGWHTRLT